MPKTLAALPSSQYATTLEFVCGHFDGFVLLMPCAAAFPTLCLVVEEKARIDCDTIFCSVRKRDLD